MKGDELLDSAISLGATIELEGNDLLMDVPPGFPKGLIESIKHEKVTVIQQLRCRVAEKDLIGWGHRLKVHPVALDQPIAYMEAPLRQITTVRVADYVREYLRTIERPATSEATRTPGLPGHRSRGLIARWRLSTHCLP